MTHSSGTLAISLKSKIDKQSFGTLGGIHFNEMTKLLRSGKGVSDVRDSTNKTPEEVGDDYSEGNQVPHSQNKDEAPNDQTGQKLKAVNIIESSNSKTFKKALHSIPQMVNILK